MDWIGFVSRNLGSRTIFLPGSTVAENPEDSPKQPEGLPCGRWDRNPHREDPPDPISVRRMFARCRLVSSGAATRPSVTAAAGEEAGDWVLLTLAQSGSPPAEAELVLLAYEPRSGVFAAVVSIVAIDLLASVSDRSVPVVSGCGVEPTQRFEASPHVPLFEAGMARLGKVTACKLRPSDMRSPLTTPASHIRTSGKVPQWLSLIHI